MAIGLDLDTEYANRTGIPNGGAGTLTAGGFADFFVGVWLYRPSATATYALTAGGAIIHGQSGAREIVLGFNSAGAALADLNLQATYNSGGGAGTPFLFTGHTGASFLNEWVYYFFYENAANEQVAGYIRHADLNTAVTNARANDNATSQFINTLTFGNTSGNTAVVLGHYAYARARDSAASAANVLTYASSSATIAGDWGFWPLANNTDTADTSGNSRSLTFGGTLSSETSPSFGAPPLQTIRPISDISAGSWTPSTGGTLFSVIDETPFSDTDFISTTVSSSCEVALGSAIDPAINYGHKISIRAKGYGTLTAQLIENTTVIATTVLPVTASYQTFVWDLSSAEVNSITNYSNLRLRFIGS